MFRSAGNTIGLLCAGLRATLLLVSCAFLLPAAVVDAADFERVAPGGGLFSIPQRWSPEGVPGPPDRAIFDLSSAYSIAFSLGGTPFDVTNDRLLVRDDNVTFNMGGATYTLTSTTSTSLVVGGGTFIFGQPSNHGKLRIVGGTLDSQSASIGSGNAGSGQIEVASGATWNSAALVTVGAGSTGSLLVESGGDVQSASAVIGSGAAGPIGGSGTATVNGNGSTWTTGGLSVGSTRNGALHVQNGGSVTKTGSGVVIIGVASGVTGTANVSGAGSTWSNSSPLWVGRFGTGELMIEDGGSVVNTDGQIGAESGSNGTVTVSGAGSTWTNSGELRVANFATGTLMIEAGGRVMNTDGHIGAESGSNGTAIVSGAGSTWTHNGGFIVGRFGTGELTIEDGGNVSNGDAAIGFDSSGTGIATVTGAGSTWTNTGSLFVGAFGTGTLAIGPGGRVSVAQDTLLFPNGLMKLEGGTLATKAIGFQGDGGQFQWTAGKLHVETYNGNLVNQGGTLAPGQSAGSTEILGNYTQQAAAALEIEIGGTVIVAEHDFVNVTGTTLLAGELQLALFDGFIPAATDTFTVLNSLGGMAGVFSNVTTGQRLTTSDGGGSFLVHYGATSAFNPNQLVLTDFELVVLPGDFNNDGIVDAADYVWWRKNAGPPEDYDEWRANFGTTAGSGAGAVADNLSAVPEPASLVLVVLAVAAGGLLRRR